MKADIKIWVLTGDKQETAINIGEKRIPNGQNVNQRKDGRATTSWRVRAVEMLLTGSPLVPAVEENCSYCGVNEITARRIATIM